MESQEGDPSGVSDIPLAAVADCHHKVFCKEADPTSQRYPIPWGFGVTRTPLRGIRVDAKRKRARLCREKSGNQSIESVNPNLC